MGINDVNLGIKVTSDAKSAIKEINDLAKTTKNLNKELLKTVNQLTSVTEAMGKSAMNMKKLSQENAKLNKQKHEAYVTNKKLLQSETLVSAIYTKNSAIAQKKYLTSLTGLKAGLQRFRDETSKVMVLEKGHVRLLDEQAMAMQRFRIQGNMVATTLDNMATRMLNTGKNMQWTGRQMMVGITLPLLGVAAASLRAAKASGVIDRQLKRVVEGGSKSLKVLNQSAVELSNTWGVNVEQIKALQVQFAQAGFNIGAIKDLTKQTQQFAIVGDVAVESAHSLVQALALTGKSGADLTLTLAKLNLIDDETSLSMQDVADAIPKIVPLFKAYGGTVEQAAALLAAFTDNSIDAVEGANTLKAILTKLPPAMAGLSDPNLTGTRLKGLRDSLTIMQKMTGIDMKLIDDEGKIRGSLDVLVQVSAAAKELKKSVEGRNALTIITRELFGAQQASRGTALLGELMEVGDQIDGIAGSANGLAKAMEIAMAAPGSERAKEVLREYERQINATLADPWTKFQQSVQKLRNIAIDFGLNQVLPVAGQLLEKITGLIERFSNLSKGTKDLIVKFALAAMALGPLIYAGGQFTIMMATLGKMVFTKPLMALFHMGRSFKGLKPEAEALKEVMDDLYAQYLRGDIDRNALTTGMDSALKRAANLHKENTNNIQGTNHLLAEQLDITESIADEVDNVTLAEERRASTYEKVFSKHYAKKGGQKALPYRPMKALGPGSGMFGPAIPGFGPGGTGGTPPTFGPGFPMGGGVASGLSGHVPHAGLIPPTTQIKTIFEKIQEQAQKSIVTAQAALARHRGGQVSITDDVRRASQTLGEATKHNKLALAAQTISRDDWEKIVPVLMQHTDITEAQMRDTVFMSKLIEDIKKDLPRKSIKGPEGRGAVRQGGPIRSESSILKAIRDRQKASKGAAYGKRGHNIIEAFPGSKALGINLDEMMEEMTASMFPEGQKLTGKPIIPQPVIEAWVAQYQPGLEAELLKAAKPEIAKVEAEARAKAKELSEAHEKAKAARMASTEELRRVVEKRQASEVEFDKLAEKVGKKTHWYSKKKAKLEAELSEQIFPTKKAGKEARKNMNAELREYARQRGRATKEWKEATAHLRAIEDAELRDKRRDIDALRAAEEKSLRELHALSGDATGTSKEYRKAKLATAAAQRKAQEAVRNGASQDERVALRKEMSSATKAEEAARKNAQAARRAQRDVTSDIRTRVKRDANAHLVSLFKKHRMDGGAASDEKGKKLLDTLKVKTKLSKVDDSILAALISESLSPEGSIEDMVNRGVIPRPILQKIAAGLYQGKTSGDIVTRLKKDLGIKDQAGLTSFVRQLSDDIAVRAGANKRALGLLRSEVRRAEIGLSPEGEVGGLVGAKGLELAAPVDFDKMMERGDLNAAYSARRAALNARLDTLAIQRQGYVRNSRKWIANFTARKIAQLKAEKLALVREWAAARALLEQAAGIGQSDMFRMMALPPGPQPFGALMPGAPMPKALGRGSVPKALGPGPRPPLALGPGKPVMPSGPKALGPGAFIMPPGPIIDVAEVIDNQAVKFVGRLRGAVDGLKDSGTRLVKGAGSVLNVRTWFGLSSGAAAATKEVGMLGKGFKSLNGLMGAFTGITLVGQGGLATILKPALPLIGVLTAIAAAIFFIWKNWDEVGPHILDGLNAIKKSASGLFNAFVEPFKKIFGLMDTGGAKGKSMSETWATVGLLINRSLHLVATILDAVAIAAGPVAWVLAEVAYTVVLVFNAFGSLPSQIQLAIAAFVLLQFELVKTKLAFAAMRIAKFIDAIIAGPRAMMAFISGLSLMQVGLIAAAAGILLIIRHMQSFKQAAQEGANAANDFWAEREGVHDLGAQQTVKDMEDAVNATSKYRNSLLGAYEAAKKKGGQGFKIGNTTIGINQGAQKEALRLEREISDLGNKFEQGNKQIQKQKDIVRILGKEYGITEKQMLSFMGQNNIDIRWKKRDVLKKFREQWQEVQTDVNGKPILPEVDTGELDAATEKLKEFYSAFQGQMRKVVDGWKESAVKGFDSFIKKQLEGYDDQVEAINKLTKAEEAAQRQREYLRRREELALKRRELTTRYAVDRNQAIYEGRYDDAAMLDMEYQRDTADLDREIQTFEEEHQRELTRIAREAEIERINDLKKAKEDELQLQKEAFQRQLDLITEFLPRNAQAARNMQAAILAAMGEKTGEYGVLATTQNALWKSTWDTAWAATNKQIEDDAYWAGVAGLKAFAKGMGVEANLPEESSPEDRSAMGPSGENYQGVREKHPMLFKHTGGGIGSVAGAPQDVDATLQTGEFVVQRKAVKKYGTGMLTALNEGQIYHAGGPVDMDQIANRGLKQRLQSATGSFFNSGAALGGMTWDKVQEAYRSALGGFGGGGSTAGMSIAQIVDNMINGIHPEFQSRLAKWNAELGGKFDISHGYRSMAQQQRLYDRWRAGVPGQALAAPPGKSMHNFGLAVDLQPSSTTAAQRAAGAKYGLRWPMGFEPWHVEPMEAAAWKQQILNGSMPGNTSGIKLVDGLFGTPTGRGDARGIVQSMMGQYGWGNEHWGALERLVSKESSWNPGAANPTSSARGLFQFLKSTWQGYITNRGGPPYWNQDIGVQAKGGLSYIKERYGDPTKALAFHNRNNWYHEGGLAQLKAGGQTLSDGVAKLHKKETVLTAPLSQELIQGIRNLSNGGETHIHLEIGNFIGSDREIEKLGKELERVMVKTTRAKGNVPRTFSTN